ncbi:phosphatases II [Panus rudis PR-1116 ss-1]|nr:phosphatases II [Panus rudis PR-1116 ss-1]
MDAIRVAKVPDTLCSKSGQTYSGTLHLTAHHLIFNHDEPEGGKEEMWVPYPLVSLVTRLPQTLSGLYPLTVRTRTFETFTLSFKTLQLAVDVFESIKELTVVTSIHQLYAFFYTPNPPFAVTNGWSIYNPREEFGRMGVGTRSKAWRFTDINKDYSFSPTYPAKLVVPTRISDTTLQYAGKYRSKCRIPVLTYLHWANYGSITRSSQPMVGITQNRSIQDEKLIEAIFQTHYSPESRASSGPIYGATTTNLIIDARPTTNAMANTAKGAGTENMDHYKDAKKAYLGIDHIHTMRESLAKVVEALRETETVSASASGNVPGEAAVAPVLDRQALRRSGWLGHISAILQGTVLIVKNIHINSSHVLIHCSDGWDRTSQLSSLSQICLDPFYRTIRGFEILVEKDWLSFGHKFLDRCGHLSSEKFFLAPVENGNNPTSGAEAAQAFFASVQNRFTGQNHIKETSPVFHQFLESVRQIQRQFPERFEFNERFLRRLHYHLYSCQFGTFLCNNERERRVPGALGENGPLVTEATVSVWDLFNSPEERELNLNPAYDPSSDDPNSRRPKADMGVLLPDPKDVRFWHELYGRTDEEMNGKFVARSQVQAQDPEFVAPVESVTDDPVNSPATNTIAAGPSGVPLPPSPSPSPAPAAIGSSSSAPRLAMQRAGSPTPAPRTAGQRTRHESLRPFDTGSLSSAFTLRTQPGSGSNVPRSPSPSIRGSSSLRGPPSPQQQQQNRPAAGDLFSAGRSVWGKLSSNASAALSVVQDAYGGVTKDLKGLTISSGAGDSQAELETTGSRGGGGELKSKDELGNAWASSSHTGQDSEHFGETRTQTQRSGTANSPLGSAGGTGPRAYSTISNPWSTTGPRQGLPSMLLDNPWSASTLSTSASSPATISPIASNTQGSSLYDPLGYSGLPHDPSVAFPAPRLTPTSSGAKSRTSLVSTEQTSLSSSPADKTLPSPPAKESTEPDDHPPPASSSSSMNMDPLGVGVW